MKAPKISNYLFEVYGLCNGTKPQSRSFFLPYYDYDSLRMNLYVTIFNILGQDKLLCIQNQSL